jgi:hypothetical protein
MSLLIAPAGLIVGGMNLKYDSRRKQAMVLLVLGIVGLVLWIVHFTSHGGHQHH